MDIMTVTGTARLTRDPEVKELASGGQVTNLRLAWTGWKDESQFIDGSVFGKTAEIASQYLAKGSAIAISGRLQYREFEAKDGSRRQAYNINITDLKLPPKSENPAAGDAATAAQDDDWLNS